MINDNMLDVLIYLFTTYADDNTSSFALPEKSSLFKELRLLGFQTREIELSLSWLNTMDNIATAELPTLGLIPASRIFHPQEALRLDKAARGFLFALEQANLITPEMREDIISNVMMLNTKNVTIEQLKYITLMVLCQYEVDEQPIQWLDTLINQPAVGTIH